MKYYWYIKLTSKEFERLKEGLLTAFRFQLRLSIPTVEYVTETMELSIHISDDIQSDIKERISCYVNGFGKAIS